MSTRNWIIWARSSTISRLRTTTPSSIWNESSKGVLVKAEANASVYKRCCLLMVRQLPAQTRWLLAAIVHECNV